MNWLNYHHLLYFWVVAREGSLVAAGKVLRLSHPTLSAQIRALEEQLGEKLFMKAGRNLALTETGKIVYRYAEEIFTLGREMVDTVKGTAGQKLQLDVGVADVVPKLVVRRLLQPALNLPTPVRLVCYEDSYDKLLADLAQHALDVVISDAPVPAGSPFRVFNHLLGETTVSFFATAPLARSYGPGFPESLNGAPVLLPLKSLTVRRALNHWFDKLDIKPNIVAEFADSALMNVFGADGIGIFPAPTVIASEVMTQYNVEALGCATDVRESFYAISAERKVKHPAVVAISEQARQDMFGREAS